MKVENVVLIFMIDLGPDFSSQIISIKWVARSWAHFRFSTGSSRCVVD